MLSTDGEVSSVGGFDGGSEDMGGGVPEDSFRLRVVELEEGELTTPHEGTASMS